MTAAVRIALHAGIADCVAITTRRHLGQAFGAYRTALAQVGARWNPSQKLNLLALEQLPELIRVLGAAGFGVEVEAELKEALQRESDEAARLAEEGRARLAEVEGRLAASGLRLFPYQRSGVQWLAPRRAALLADEMGLGKTVQFLVAVPKGAPALVVAPAAVQFSWLREAARWRPDMKASIGGSARDFRWPRAGELLITTYGSLPHAEKEEGEEEQSMMFGGGILMPNADTVLGGDEAHLLKNSRATRTKRWRQLRDSVLACGGRVWIITGTPLLNRPRELWSVLDAAGLAKQAFGSYPRFAELFIQGPLGWEPREEVPLALQKVSLHRRRAAVMPDLPPKLRQQRRVEIDEATVALCDEVVRRLKEQGIDLIGADEQLTMIFDEGALASRAEEALSTKLTGVAFELISRVRAALASAKLPAAIERVEAYEEEGVPLLVFCAHVDPLRVIGQREGWAVIDGTVSPERRAELVEQFQTGALRGLALSFAAGGVGITLTRAHHALCIDLPWTPALLQQAEDRMCRIGQKAQNVHVEILEADHPLDWRVAELLLEKARLIEAAVEASAQPEDYVGEAPADVLAQAAQSVSVAIDTAGAESTRSDIPDFRKPGELRMDPHCTFIGKFRAPRNEVELHAGRALMELAAMDPDHATSRNGIGFSQFDNEFGHSLASNLRDYGRLSDRQWEAALKLAHRYRAQVGEAAAVMGTEAS